MTYKQAWWIEYRNEIIDNIESIRKTFNDESQRKYRTLMVDFLLTMDFLSRSPIDSLPPSIDAIANVCAAHFIGKRQLLESLPDVWLIGIKNGLQDLDSLKGWKEGKPEIIGYKMINRETNEK